MHDHNPIVDQIGERIRQLETELAELQATGSEKKKEIRKHRQALKMLEGNANQPAEQT